jgi:hypothetical protein
VQSAVLVRVLRHTGRGVRAPEIYLGYT